jgi:hypothetical protein
MRARSQTAIDIPEDSLFRAFERMERRVVLCSLLLAKTVSVLAILAALIILEGGAIVRLWTSEFDHGTPRTRMVIERPDPPAEVR